MKKLKGWKLFLFSMAGFGPNLMMTLVTGYLNDALLAPDGISPAKTITGTILISAGLGSVLFFIAKIIDGVIDVPLAYINDKMHCKLGRRKLGILLGWIPMVLSFILIWNPGIFSATGEVGTTIVEALLLIIFYSSYTMCLVSYYGSFSIVVETEKERLRLSHFKAFFDTVQYCFAYALFPSLLLTLLGGKETGAISSALLKLSPLMLTMLIPVLLLKEEDDKSVNHEVPLVESIKLSFKNKSFRAWLLTLLMMHMGLMLFLTGIGTTIPDSLMGISGWQVTVMNSAAFAPVPLMLLLFNYIKKKRGMRVSIQTSLIAFALAMFTFAAAWKSLWNSPTISLIIGLIASTIGSYAIGVFFSSSYYFPSQIAALEISEKKIDHSAMYFAVQGLVTQVAGAIAVNLIYMNLIASPMEVLGKEGGQFFLIPVIAGVMMILAFFCTFKMAKDGISEKGKVK
ncbi:MAG: MFS transporter [Lachnospiraceae bacterium]|nr:MFS transporter [Lachnospiraceae bacterium]